MSEISYDAPGTGRPVRLAPTAPGFWLLVLGVCIAALSPLLGFLLGVMAQQPSGEVRLLSPLYWGLFVGVTVGGAGVLLAVFGGLRLWRHYKAGESTAPTTRETAQP
ncbi:hypothetical protein [Tessaracoccus massiliensis]|uniref:hypothetical protein n=1 Tax=Tessaracoccus massiliensis TaxID=1522311 RepID=UPI0006937FEF|nr:hypothetical protein [Tessaracoccus massiliensis]